MGSVLILVEPGERSNLISQAFLNLGFLKDSITHPNTPDEFRKMMRAMTFDYLVVSMSHLKASGLKLFDEVAKTTPKEDGKIFLLDSEFPYAVANALNNYGYKCDGNLMPDSRNLSEIEEYFRSGIQGPEFSVLKR